MMDEKTYKSILEDPALKQNPYSVPEGYFADVEDRVKDVIDGKKVKTPQGFAKFTPALMMALMFLIIGGLGLGVSRITDMVYTPEQETSLDGIQALIEEGYIEHDFIYRYYDRLDTDDALTYQTDNHPSHEDIEEYIINSMTVEEIYYHTNKE